ncbi:ABC transporter permease [Utexia brackfieldae]|uniref:ABC transporter permease n=1 Tax=Utexia brackfieldae TaxID=3074108 RepID=UPI00370D7C76
MRIWTLICKELLLLLRDKQTRIVLIMPVLVQVTIFPFAATLNVSNATLAIYDQDHGQPAQELIARLAQAEPFSRLDFVDSRSALQSSIDNQTALLAVILPANFSQQLLSPSPADQTSAVQLVLDGRHSNSAQLAANYVQQIIAQYRQALVCQQTQQCQSTQLVVRNWFNPNLDYKWFVLPSLVALITTIGVLVVTALSIAREREQGTFEQLLVSPLSTWQIFIGKAIPALVIAMVQGSIILLVGIFFFQIVFQGSLLLYYFCMLIYGCSLVGFGLLISALCSTQQQAFIGIIVFMVPAILLSGYISPVENMPEILRYITWVNPVRHFTELTKQIYLKGGSLPMVWQSLYPLLVITVFTISLAYLFFKKRIG